MESVCVACLLPLFLIPLVNALPLLINFILGKVYGIFGWEYRKRERVVPACPYKPVTKKNVQDITDAQTQLGPQEIAADVDKQE